MHAPHFTAMTLTSVFSLANNLLSQKPLCSLSFEATRPVLL